MQTQETIRPEQNDDTHAGPSRRTVLAAERTWLAWWRTGIAVSGAAVAIGGLIPRLVDSSQWVYITLGALYALLAVGIFVISYLRHREIAEALASGLDVSTGRTWMLILTVCGGILALATLVAVIFFE